MTDSKEQGATPRTDAVYRGDGKTLTLVVGSCWHIEGGGAQCIDCVTSNENDLSAFYEKRLALVAECSETLERELSALQAKADGLQSGNVRLWERAQSAEATVEQLQGRVAELEGHLGVKENSQAREMMLYTALDSLYDSLVAEDEEGLIEHAVPMIVAKSALHDSDANEWLQERLKLERERIILVAEEERLDAEETQDPGDDAYNQAIRDVIAAIRALPDE